MWHRHSLLLHLHFWSQCIQGKMFHFSLLHSEADKNKLICQRSIYLFTFLAASVTILCPFFAHQPLQAFDSWMKWMLAPLLHPLWILLLAFTSLQDLWSSGRNHNDESIILLIQRSIASSSWGLEKLLQFFTRTNGKVKNTMLIFQLDFFVKVTLGKL